jgi:hypothetical protein
MKKQSTRKPGFVIDMNHCTTPDTHHLMSSPKAQSLELGAGNTADAAPNSEPDGNSLRVREDACHRIMRALELATGRGTLDIAVAHDIHDRNLQIEYRAKVTAVNKAAPRGSASMATYVIAIELAKQPGRRTRLEVKLGFRQRKENTEAWVGVQGNGGSLLSGQNTWPLRHIFKSPKAERAAMFCWPFLLLIEVCRAGAPGFEPPLSMLKSVLRGEAVYQNVQFAINLPMKEERKDLALGLIGAHYRSPAFKAKSTSLTSKVVSFDLGDMIGVTAERYIVRDNLDQPTCEGIMIQKWQGNNRAATLAFYDKALQLQLDQDEAEQRGLLDLIRADITLRKGDMAKMFTAAKEAAAGRSKTLEFQVNGRRQVTCSAANIITAIEALDRYYRPEPDEVDTRNSGFVGWLVAEVVCGWFYLKELLDDTPQRRKLVKAWMAKWSAKGSRYRKAFKRWTKAVQGHDTNLRKCLTGAGLSKDAADDRLRELRALGCSGRIPPRYWIALDEIKMGWGSTFEEAARFHRRGFANKPVGELLEVRRQRVKRALRSISRALDGIDHPSVLRTAPITGDLISREDGVVEWTGDIRKPLAIKFVGASLPSARPSKQMPSPFRPVFDSPSRPNLNP